MLSPILQENETTSKRQHEKIYLRMYSEQRFRPAYTSAQIKPSLCQETKASLGKTSQMADMKADPSLLSMHMSNGSFPHMVHLFPSTSVYQVNEWRWGQNAHIASASIQNLDMHVKSHMSGSSLFAIYFLYTW